MIDILFTYFIPARCQKSVQRNKLVTTLIIPHTQVNWENLKTFEPEIMRLLNSPRVAPDRRLKNWAKFMNVCPSAYKYNGHGGARVGEEGGKEQGVVLIAELFRSLAEKGEKERRGRANRSGCLSISWPVRGKCQQQGQTLTQHKPVERPDKQRKKGSLLFQEQCQKPSDIKPSHPTSPPLPLSEHKMASASIA